jgi:Rrf2 family transcriptional regulator, cysteine metabolism repressor
MKLSTKGKYGVRALFEIAKQYGKGPLSIKEIAGRQQISLSYLEQILHRLGKAGIIDSVRGPHGGYALARKPAGVTIGDVVRALEGPIALSHCLEPGEDGSCRQADDCVARMVWAEVGEKIETALDSISFEDLLRQSRGKDRERGAPVHRRRLAAAGRGVC